MMGSVFAGTEESPGETIIYEGRKFKEYRGMGSMGAMAPGSSDRYFQDVEDDIKKFVPEGIEGRVHLKELLKKSFINIQVDYEQVWVIAVQKISMNCKKATFVKITNAGMRESHAHDIEITKEAPNYSRKIILTNVICKLCKYANDKPEFLKSFLVLSLYCYYHRPLRRTLVLL